METPPSPVLIGLKAQLPQSYGSSFTCSGGGGDSMIPENSEYFGRTIPNDILPFLFSSHHDNLKCSRNFENLSVIKIPSSELSFWHYT